MIYLDSAATSYYRPKEVAQAVYDAILTMGNAGRGAHETALLSARVIYETRSLLNELFHGDGPQQTAFTSNGTEALNLAIRSLTERPVRAAATAMDHNSVLRPLYQAQRRGCRLDILPADRKGNISLDALERLLKRGLDLFVCTHASNVTGNVNNIRRIGHLCRSFGTVFVLDASQTAGIFPIDMQRDEIDIVCFTGHKSLMGPQGTGGICIREGLKLSPLKTGGSGIQSFSKTHPAQMPEALEAGTLNGHGIAGLRAALLYLKEQGSDRLRKREQGLMRRFVEGVGNLPGIQIYGDFSSPERGATVALNIGAYDSAAVSDELAQCYGIQTRPGAHCAPLMHEALGTREQGAVRFSFSHFLTEEQIDSAVRALEEMTKEL